ncbi:hypothetical protein DFQ28_002717 [Apophysomyces sp. BC1034]|nr:hypothetical protein DFQ30_003018 [Apophysomyces sp. BC1015]KAG0179581.1 hypothetical protein DFQ29_001900 [Apophysomyces sp. BC1021]KAG0189929.1 hypothetical protein DFQ28_002717 [Apophysomyces sp. BC1034]
MRGITAWMTIVISSLLIVFSVTEAKSVSGDRVLVLLDDLADKDLYSRFWSTLQERDFALDFKKANDESAALEYFGEAHYDHIIHFAPRTNNLAKHKTLSNVHLVKFVNDGGNLLIAAGNDPSSAVRDLASEFDIEFDLRGSSVFDHKALDDEHRVITTTKVVTPSIVDGTTAPVMYSGIGLSKGSLPLSNRVLTSESTAFSANRYNKNEKTTEAVDLVCSLQGRNSARTTVVGSLDIFSDKFFEVPIEQKRADGSVEKFEKSGNRDFVVELTKWTFQEKSVLRVDGHHHSKQNETEQADAYRVKDDIVYELDISEYKNDIWVPFKADDVQLEIIMLDPYIRTTLKQDSSDGGRFRAELRLPDVYGVFTFRVNYKRAGLTYLSIDDTVAIRPFRHNEYPRYLTAAYPYYASVASMIVGFVTFSTIWLCTWGSREAGSTKQKAQ